MKYIRQLGIGGALAAALVMGACKGDDRETDTLASDTALSNDLALAGQDTAAQPGLSDVPAGGTAKTSTKTGTSGTKTTTKTTSTTKTATGNVVTKTAAGSEGTVASIGAGTSITLTSGTKVCTNTHKTGDRFTATVAETVVGSNGATIPAGAQAVVQVGTMKKSENVNDPVVMSFNVISITFSGRTYPVTGTVTTAQVEKIRTSSKSSDAKKVAAGAAIGAIAGQVLGKDTKSTVIGAAAGAAAGTAAAVATGDYDGCVNPGGRIVVRLDSPMTITTAD